MGKKKLTDNDVVRTLGRGKQTGRRPKDPVSVDGRLEQLIKESSAWLRMFREVWFDPSSPLIELAVGAKEMPDLPNFYDDAIDAMRSLAASSSYGEKTLLKGKAEAIRKHQEAVKHSAAPPSKGARGTRKTRRSSGTKKQFLK